MKKVLIFMAAGVGGAERMSLNIGKHLPVNDFDIEYILVGNEQAGMLDFLPADCKYSIVRGNSLRVVFHMNYLILNKKPDVVFCSIKPLSIKLLLFRRLFPKCRYIIRCDNYLSYYTPRGRKQVTVLYKQADYIIAQTEEMKEELVTVSVPDNKIHVLHNPIDQDLIGEKIKQPAAFEKKPLNTYYVAIGRFSPDKGFDVLIKAFAKVVTKNPHAELYIVGKNDGYATNYYLQLLDLAKNSSIEERVHFPGFTNNPYSYLKSADCFVMASRREGLPNTLLDALYLGVPVAAVKCIPIIGRIVKDGSNGYLAEVEDEVSLAEAMLNAPHLDIVGLEEYKAASYSEFTKLFA